MHDHEPRKRPRDRELSELESRFLEEPHGRHGGSLESEGCPQEEQHAETSDESGKEEEPRAILDRPGGPRRRASDARE